MRSGLALCLVVLLSACVPTAVETVMPATPSGTTGPTPARTTPSASPSPTSPSEPTPTPTPDPAAMRLTATSCNGGVVLRWSPSTHPDFHHYIGLRSPEKEIEPDFPPIAPAVDWGDLYATDRFVASGFDATVVPSSTTWHYRVMAYDAAGRVVSRSNVASAQILEQRSLGSLEVEIVDGGRVRIAWDRFDGVPDCFSSYRVLHGSAGIAATLLTTISDRREAEIETDALRAGATHTLRVQAVHTTALGHFVLGESEPATAVVPDE